jgi:hypothetical protein
MTLAQVIEVRRISFYLCCEKHAFCITLSREVRFTEVPSVTQQGLVTSGFGGLAVSALAFGTQVRGLKPGRRCRIFQGEKILSALSFGREVKPWVLCR